MSADRTAATPPALVGDARQVNYDIRAPDGGLRPAVEAYLSGSVQFIDMTISSGPGHLVSVRVYPERDKVRADSRRNGLVHIFAATAFRLEDGDEVGPPLMASGRVNLQVTHAPLEAGKLGLLFNEGDPL